MFLTVLEPGLITAGAAVGAVVYLGREVRKLAKVITFWSGLPAAHEELRHATRINTEAIRDMSDRLGELTVQVAHLTAVERARGSGETG